MTSHLPSTGFLRLKHIIGDAKQGIMPLFPICKTEWWNGVRDGKYPQPIKLSANITVWRVEDIRRLIESTGG